MLEKYSNGIHANVYKLSERSDKWAYPFADLARVDRTYDRSYSARLYYEHKIASLLFPGHFIDVVATKVVPHGEPFFTDLRIGKTVLKIPGERTYTLFSKQADVPERHAVYSSHMIVDHDDGERLVKESVCTCSQCDQHRKFHYSHVLKDLAEAFAKQTDKAGIKIPSSDPSDYCLGRSGIIFFEIDNLDTKKLREFLAVTNNKDMEEKAIHYLKRYEEVSAASA